SISSNMACRMASRNVISFPPAADPLVGAPFAPAMTTSAPFAKYSLRRASLSSERPLPSSLFPLSGGGRCLPVCQQRLYRQNESVHLRRRNLCPSQIQERSTRP